MILPIAAARQMRASTGPFIAVVTEIVQEPVFGVVIPEVVQVFVPPALSLGVASGDAGALDRNVPSGDALDSIAIASIQT